MDPKVNFSLDEVCCYALYKGKVSLQVPLGSKLGKELARRFSLELSESKLRCRAVPFSYMYNGTTKFNGTVQPIHFEIWLTIATDDN